MKRAGLRKVSSDIGLWIVASAFALVICPLIAETRMTSEKYLKELSKINAWYEKEVAKLTASHGKSKDFKGRMDKLVTVYKGKIETLAAKYTADVKRLQLRDGVQPPASKNPPDKHAADNTKFFNFARISIEPFYYGPGLVPGPPGATVAIDPAYDDLLSSNKPEDIKHAKEKALGDGAHTSFLVLFALAARLYDIGLRDDAVFVYYIARNRLRLTEAVADTSAFSAMLTAGSEFNASLEHYMHGYAFGHIDRQVATFRRAAEWTQKNPYRALAKYDTSKALESIMQQAKQNEDYFRFEENRSKLKADRAQSYKDAYYGALDVLEMVELLSLQRFDDAELERHLHNKFELLDGPPKGAYSATKYDYRFVRIDLEMRADHSLILELKLSTSGVIVVTDESVVEKFGKPKGVTVGSPHAHEKRGLIYEYILGQSKVFFIFQTSRSKVLDSIVLDYKITTR